MSNLDLRTLWVGDIENWMTEQFIESVFNKVGKVVSVKLIRTKETSLPAGYCFVEFQTHEQAERILMNYNQQLIPGTQNTFRMNWGKNPTNTGIIKQPTTQANNGYGNNQYGMMQQPVIQMPPIQEFSIYVGELELGINEQQLAEHFRSKYSSVIGSKIITEPTSKMSKGYGFVKFSNPIEGQRAIHEMNGSLFKGKFIKVSQAVSRQQQQAQAQAAGTPGFPQPAGYGAATGAADYNGYGYYPQQPSQDPYYQYQQQYAGYASTQNTQYQYPYSYSSSYYQNGVYGTDPSQMYGQPAQASNMHGYQYPATASTQNAQGQAQQYSQQYPQQGQVPQVPTATTATNPAAIQQQYYNQTAQTPQAANSQQVASTHDKYSQNNYQSQQQSASNAHYSQQQQYSHQQQQSQVQSQASSQSQTAQQQQLSTQQQLNQTEKKSDANSIPTPSVKESSLFQKPSSDFIGYQTEYVSMTGELEFILKHNIC
ncbi:RNA recognition motif protein (macronuclear) [Tetrahymena thermophila SB210]|uniref:RNA recognition motif protein n=1 Tax=Tetrahymena thermophila (strain SB210) TaxID=312017 RepID=I7MLH3_TETTS|nr:RNA recognition motif protein [Tetrahymena thermophila SB210]EAS02100.3 RNA recognition motif protein [Tetrahymena thermophila SB210]|eukprot:XP_001022345.3 RNA recognition motif protein [Tetrahymena thermophila SB210]